MIFWCDFETRSPVDLKTCGTYQYMRQAEVLCMSYAVDDAPVQTWRPGMPFPDIGRAQIRAHNAGFERLVFWHVLDMKIPIEQFYCTAAQARANCMPGSLEDVGRFCGASMRKDHKGAALVRKFCVLPYSDDDPAELIAYCEQDVRAMRAASQSMRDLSPDELADYHVSEYINDRGVRLDVDLALAAVQYAKDEAVEIEARVREVTEGEVTSVRSPKMREWVLARVTPEQRELMIVGEKWSIDKAVRANLLACDDLAEDVREVVQCADDLWASSVAKFARLAALADARDHRVRGAFVFAGGAATGRFASYGAQVHNFSRKVHKQAPEVRRAMVRGHALVPTYGPRVTDVLRSMLRPALIPKDGCVFIVADWSSIEARVTPWLAGASGEAKLDVFRSGRDPYIVNAAGAFRVAYEEVTEAMRQIGKVMELACLSEDTLVLTSCGEKPIQDVRSGDLVWDGVDWVATDGAVYKGEKHVIEYDGLCATPDHLVWVDGEENPVELGWAAANRLRLARSGARAETPLPRASKASVSGETEVPKPEVAGLSNVWCEGGAVFVSYGAGSVRLGGGKHRPATGKDGVGPDRQSLRLRARELALVYEGSEQEPYFKDCERSSVSSLSRTVSEREVRRQHAAESIVDGVYFRADSGAVGSTKLQAKRRVWDLLNCGPLHRFTAQGRLVHNCGFAGGAGAFAAMGRAYGMVLPEAEAKRMVTAWRRVNAWAPPFWDALESAYLRAMRNPGHEFSAGRVTYLFDRQHLWYALPSGRILCYPFARLEAEGVSYAKAAWKPMADADEWPRGRLWKGLAAENATQATAADILRHSLRRLPDVVLHVHDEIVQEVPADAADSQRLVSTMTTPPVWAAGLPLACSAKVMTRYGK